MAAAVIVARQKGLAVAVAVMADVLVGTAQLTAIVVVAEGARGERHVLLGLGDLGCI